MARMFNRYWARMLGTDKNDGLLADGRVRALLLMVCDPDQDYVWRVQIDEFGGVVCKYIGYIRIDGARVLRYHSIESAPEWIQDAVAVLRMLPADVDESVIKGRGRRISEDVFWVVQPMETIS